LNKPKEVVALKIGEVDFNHVGSVRAAIENPKAKV